MSWEGRGRRRGPFVASRDGQHMALAVDRLARRYGVLPTAILALDARELAIVLTVSSIAGEEAAATIQRHSAAGVPVFPAIVLDT